MKEIIERLSKIEHGFKPIELEAKNIFVSKPIADSKKLAIELLENDFYQVRSLAVFLLGFISSADSTALQILRTKVSIDKSWQVQEILAKSFDQYCMDTGYENSLPVIEDWLSDKNPNVCRAVTEGLRIWTGRPFFKSNPQIAIQLISQHKAHESEYLRKSVGNSLRDISKKHKELIEKEVSTWNLSNKLIHFTYKYVMKTLIIIGIIAAIIPSNTFAQKKHSIKFTLSGTVRNDSSRTNPKEIIKGAIITLIGSDGSVICDTTNGLGKYQFGTTKIHAITSYKFTVESKGCFGAKAQISTVGLDSSKDFVQDFNLVPIPIIGDPFPEVRFEKGKWELAAQNKDSLEALIITLNDNPKLVMEFRTHTEPGITQEYHDTLSYKRAKALVDYFISRGIEAGRLRSETGKDNTPRTLYKDTECNGFVFPKGAVLTADYINQFKDNKEKYEAVIKLCNFIDFRALRQNYDPKNDEQNKDNPAIIIKSERDKK